MANKPLTVPPPYLPAEYDAADIAAVRALAAGNATEQQQKRALDWLINRVCLTYDLEYRPDGRDHAFASGRRFVGLQIVKALHLVPSKVVEADRLKGARKG